MSMVFIVTTTGKYHATRVEAIRASWAKERPLDVLFMSDAPSAIPTVLDLKCSPDYSSAPLKTVFGLRALQGTNYATSDWIIVCDDDSLMFPSRIEQFLSTQNPDIPVCFGRRIKDFPPLPDLHYPGGGAGYALSRAALALLQEKLPTASLYAYSDVTIGVLLALLKIPVVHVRGFNADPPERCAQNGSPESRIRVMKQALSFHYIQAERMVSLFRETEALPHEPEYGEEVQLFQKQHS